MGPQCGHHFYSSRKLKCGEICACSTILENGRQIYIKNVRSMLQVAQQRAVLAAAIAAAPARAMTTTATSTKAVAQYLSIWNTDRNKEKSSSARINTQDINKSASASFITRRTTTASTSTPIYKEQQQRRQQSFSPLWGNIRITTTATTTRFHLPQQQQQRQHTPPTTRRGGNHITTTSSIIEPLPIRLQCFRRQPSMRPSSHRHRHVPTQNRVF